MKLRTPFPQAMSTKPGKGGFFDVGPLFTSSPPKPYISLHNSIKNAAMPRSSNTPFVASVTSCQYCSSSGFAYLFFNRV